MTITSNPFVRVKTEARGFALYVGIDEATAAQLGTSLAEIVIALRKTLEEISPGLSLETFAALALVLTPVMSEAKPGGNSSSGSRGSRTRC